MSGHPIGEGALVRLSRDLTDEERGWFGSTCAYRGQEFVIEEYLPAAGNPDPQPDDIPVDFYYGSANGGMNNVTAPADALEVIRTAAQMAARRPPTRPVIRDAVQSALTGLSADTFECNETDRDGSVCIEVYGRTTDGLPFGFRVRVEQVWKTDL